MRLLVVDDQALIRRGLALMLDAEDDICVVGQAADGAQALQLVGSLRPDVVLMDLQMPHMDGVAATQALAAQWPEVRVVVLTTFDDDARIFDALRAGAQAYLLKDTSEAELLQTVRAVHRGQSQLSPQVAHKVLEQFRAMAPAPCPSAAPTPHEALSAKETQVLQLLADGLSNREIAARVFLAEGTVKNHVSRIMDKLQIHNRTELALKAASGYGLR